MPLQAPDGVTVNFGGGKAEMTATDLAVEDYFDIPNALFRFVSAFVNPFTWVALSTRDGREVIRGNY